MLLPIRENKTRQTAAVSGKVLNLKSKTKQIRSKRLSPKNKLKNLKDQWQNLTGSPKDRPQQVVAYDILALDFALCRYICSLQSLLLVVECTSPLPDFEVNQ